MSMEEPIECPLCMEPLEMDDICFFPCTCGYQICRFCWHRIRTDENGLCPACRKPYQEDPAEFKPLTEEELQRIKKERRQKDLQRKQKAAENRKHLANVRVVQKNLVFVVGLSQRLADQDALKKHEYFGKFGKIHKVVINQSTSYAGAQGPSASAYVTYNRPEDALRAIQAVNNIFVDGRTIKASLGTTKYCSHFLRGAQCPKPDCMYLHELGEEAASFTKEEMQQGKHQEYEQKLYEMYVTAPQLIPNSTSTTSSTTTPAATTTSSTKEKHSKRKNGSPVMGQQPHPPHQTNKDAWPSLGNNGKSDRVSNGHKAPPQNSKSDSSSQNRTVGNNRNRHNMSPQEANGKTKTPSPSSQNSQPSPPLHTSSNSTEQLSPPIPTQKPQPVANSVPRKVPFTLDNADSSLSLFSSNGFPTVKKPPVQQPPQVPPEDSIPTTEISDSIPVSYATDWQAAFGFGSSTTNTDTHEDDLGFDPWRESSKALADLIEKEATSSAFDDKPKSTVPPPGFSSNHFGAYSNSLRTGIEQQSKMLRLLSLSSAVPSKPNAVNTYNDVLSEYTLQHRDGLTNNHIQNNDVYNMKDWQEGLRALLPNINISFGGASTQHPQTAFPQPNRTQTAPAGFSQTSHFTQSPPPQMQAQSNKPLSQPATATDLSWDPAIVSSGNVTENNHSEEPHWMASLQHLTEVDPPAPNHRFPYMQSFPFRAPTWGTQTQHPPPGFQTPLRTPAQMPETQKLAGGLQ